MYNKIQNRFMHAAANYFANVTYYVSLLLIIFSFNIIMLKLMIGFCPLLIASQFYDW